MKKFLIGIVVVALLGGLSFWYQKSIDKPAENLKPTVTTETIKEDNKELGIGVDAEYPKISGLIQNDVGDIINENIKREVGLTINGFKEQTSEKTASSSKDFGGTINIRYVATTSRGQILNVKLNGSEYNNGAAHPNNYSLTYNYDLKTGNDIKLADIFKDSSYLKIISDYSILDLKKQLKDTGVTDNEINDGASPKSENYNFYLIADGGLKIIFNPYQVGPYALGEQEVLVPYGQIKNLLKPEWSFLAK